LNAACSNYLVSEITGSILTASVGMKNKLFLRFTVSYRLIQSRKDENERLEAEHFLSEYPHWVTLLYISNCVNDIFKDMNTLYNEGAEHRAAERQMWTRFGFMCHHSELEYRDGADSLPVDMHQELINTLYGAYVDGFNSVSTSGAG